MKYRSLPRSCLAPFVVLLFLGIPAEAAFPSPPPNTTVRTAAASGAWNAPSTWMGGVVPQTGDAVVIPATVKVTVTHVDAQRLKFIRVEGQLWMWIHGNTRLLVETLFVSDAGWFNIGDAANPVKPGVRAEVVLTTSGQAIDLAWDPKQESRGFFSKGKVRIYGQPKSATVSVSADVPKGSTFFFADSSPVNWSVGDEIVIAGSHFRRNTSSQDEKVAITGVSANRVDFSPALVHDHRRPPTPPAGTAHALHVTNLTRNVVFRSESTVTAHRGHVLLTKPDAASFADIDVRHAAFVDLGRTDKRIPLDDFIVDTTTGSVTPRTNTQIQNRRGRYALHVHEAGASPAAAAPPIKVYGSVVNRTTGWGFVNHSSHVDFQDNVAFDFAGAGFVTEAGDELGNFYRNTAIRGTGNGEYRKVRIVFGNLQRPQPLADFGFSGDGFWFQGPALRVRDNVANGCNGAGMIWFTTGAVNPSLNRYTGFPRSWLSSVYGTRSDFSTFLPRYWDYDSNKIVVSDLPILECVRFHAYGNLVGFSLRFNNYNNVDWYNEDPYDYDVHIVPVIGGDPKAAQRMRQRLEDLNLWNNEEGFSVRYAMRTDWVDIDNVNRLSYNARSPYDGAEINFQIQQTTFSDLTIDGYDVAGWVENANTNVRNQITFTGQAYSNYVNFDTWNTSLTCAEPSVVTVSNVTSSGARISWNANGAHTRYLVRYKITTDQPWRYATTTGTFVNLSGLTSQKAYAYQVIAGCKDSSGKETAPSSWTTELATFTTL